VLPASKAERPPRRSATAQSELLEIEPATPGNPVFSMPNVIISPHSAASTEEGTARMAEAAARNTSNAALAAQDEHTEMRVKFITTGANALDDNSADPHDVWPLEDEGSDTPMVHFYVHELEVVQ
jgi:hypothetical protein